jgi:hypothetical protein
MQQLSISTDRDSQDVRDLTLDEILIIAGADGTAYPILPR